MRLSWPQLCVPRRRWRLKTALLVPIVLLVPVILALTGTLWEGAARRDAENLVAQRQATALDGLSARLEERRQANKTIAYLLAARQGLGHALEGGDTVSLAKTLAMMQSSLELAYINVYASNGQLMVHAGEPVPRGSMAPGRRRDSRARSSVVATSSRGLVISAAATIRNDTGSAGSARRRH